MRNIWEAAERLANASPDDLRLIATHDWDMIRDVAAFLSAMAPVVEGDDDAS